MSQNLIDKLLSEKESRKAEDVYAPVKNWYRSTFNVDIPTSNLGSSEFERQAGWEHSRSFDVGLNPNSREGTALVQYLQAQGIPYSAFSGPVKRGGLTVSTGAHIHVGPPSQRISNSNDLDTNQGSSLIDTLLAEKESQINRPVDKRGAYMERYQAARRSGNADAAGFDKLARDIEWHFGYSILAGFDKLPSDKQIQIAREATEFAQKDEANKQAAFKKTGQYPMITKSRAWQWANQDRIGIREGKEIEVRLPPEEQTKDQLRNQVIKQRQGFQGGSQLGLPVLDIYANVLEAVSSPIQSVKNLFKTEEQIVNEQTEERYQQHLRSLTPEMLRARKEWGTEFTIPERAVFQPLVKATAGVVKELGGVASVFGFTPNRVSNWLNAKANLAIEAANDAPLNAQGDAIIRRLPEKAAQAVTELGLTVAQLALLKKASGISMSKLMGLEAALKNNDKPLAEQSAATVEAMVRGKVLDKHLSRKASAVLFGGPTALQSLTAMNRGEMSLEDALLQTSIQSGAGFILGGKRKPVRIENRLATPEEIRRLALPPAMLSDARMRGREFELETGTPKPTGPQTVSLPARQTGAAEVVKPGEQGELFTATRPGVEAGREDLPGFNPTPLTKEAYAQSKGLELSDPLVDTFYKEYLNKVRSTAGRPAAAPPKYAQWEKEAAEAENAWNESGRSTGASANVQKNVADAIKQARETGPTPEFRAFFAGIEPRLAGTTIKAVAAFAKKLGIKWEPQDGWLAAEKTAASSATSSAGAGATGPVRGGLGAAPEGTTPPTATEAAKPRVQTRVGSTPQPMQMEFTLPGAPKEATPIFDSRLESPQAALVRLQRLRLNPEIWDNISVEDRRSISKSIADLKSGKTPAQILDEAALSSQYPGTIRMSEETARKNLKDWQKQFEELKGKPTRTRAEKAVMGQLKRNIDALMEQGVGELPEKPKAEVKKPDTLASRMGLSTRDVMKLTPEQRRLMNREMGRPGFRDVGEVRTHIRKNPAVIESYYQALEKDPTFSAANAAAEAAAGDLPTQNEALTRRRQAEVNFANQYFAKPKPAKAPNVSRETSTTPIESTTDPIEFRHAGLDPRAAIKAADDLNRPGITVERPDQRDFRLRDYLRTPLSNVNFMGALERIGGPVGRKASDAIRNFQVNAQENVHKWQRSIDEIDALLQRERGVTTLRDKILDFMDPRKRVAKQKFYEDFAELVDKAPGQRGTLSPDMQRAVEAHDALTKEQKQYIIDSRRAVGIEMPANWGITDKGYFRHLFLGDIQIIKDGKLEDTAGSYSEAQKKALDIQKREPKAKFLIKGRNTFAGLPGLRLSHRVGKQVTDHMKSGSTKGEDVAISHEDLLADIEGKVSAKQKFYGPLLKREGYEGFSKAYKVVMEATSSQLARSQELTKLNYELAPIIQYFKENGKPLLGKQLEKRLNQLWGNPRLFDKVIGSTIRQTPILRNVIRQPDMAYQNLIKGLTGAQTFWRLDFSTRASVINGLDTLTTLWPEITSREYATLVGQMFRPSTRARLRELGVFEGATKLEGNTAVTGRKYKIPRPFRMASNFNRGLGYLAGEMKGQRDGLTGEALHRNGLEWAKKVEFDNSLTNVAPILSSPEGRLFGQFKGYQFKSLENLANLAKKREGDKPYRSRPARLGKFAAGRFVVGGTKALIPGPIRTSAYLLGYGLVTALSGQLQRAGMDKDKADRLAKVIYYGPPAEAGLDLSASVSVIDEFYGSTPEEKIVSFAAGPTVGGLVGAYKEGKQKNPSYAKLAERLSPYARSFNTAKEMYDRGGAASIPAGRGERIDLTPYESVMRVLGFTPLKQSLHFERGGSVKRQLIDSLKERKRKGDATVMQEAHKLEREGKLEPENVTEIRESTFKEDYVQEFKRLRLDAAEKKYKEMTPEQQQEVEVILKAKRRNKGIY